MTDRRLDSAWGGGLARGWGGVGGRGPLTADLGVVKCRYGKDYGRFKAPGPVRVPRCPRIGRVRGNLDRPRRSAANPDRTPGRPDGMGPSVSHSHFRLPPSAHDTPNRPGRDSKGMKTTHARYVIFQMAEVAVPKRLFRAILDRIRRLRPPDSVPG